MKASPLFAFMIIVICSHVFPVVRVQQCNYATTYITVRYMTPPVGLMELLIGTLYLLSL